MTNKEARNTVMPFGKYKGMLLSDVKLESERYLEWILDQIESKTDEASKKLSRAIYLTLWPAKE